MRYLILLFFSFFLFLNVQSQTDSTRSQKVIVKTIDGLERVGVILQDDGREILLLTESIGKVFIRKENIVSIYLVPENNGDEIEEYMGDYRSSGPFTTRYYLTTNALPIKKGEDYAMLHLYGPEVHYALNDRFSLGIMTSWIASPFVLAAKYTIPTSNENINFGIGTLFGSSGYLNTFRGFGGLHWGMVSFGNRMRNITVSAGFSYVQAGFVNEEYQIGQFDWIETINPADSTQTIWEAPEIPMEDVQGSLITAPVVSIAGVTKVGKRSSFFVDAMAFFYSNLGPEQRIREDVFDPVIGANVSTIINGVTSGQSSGTMILVMPGMRFQKKENRAFQIALAGYTRIRDNEVLTLPVPMCSWLIKF